MSCLQTVRLDPTPLPWYALRIKSNHEKIAAAVLQGKGYEAYLPLYRVHRRRAERTVETSLPLLSGYVFCRFDASVRLPILTTPGVVSIIGFGGQPAPIPDNEIDAVGNVLRSGLAAEPCPFLREGQRIRVTNGSLAGLEGILVQKRSQWRVVISVEMLQRSLSVEIDHESVSAL